MECKIFRILFQCFFNLHDCTFNNILFIHAWSGCDSTSTIFDKGKTSLMKLIAKGVREMLDICSILDKTDATPEEIGKAGVKLFVTTYGIYYESF